MKVFSPKVSVIIAFYKNEQYLRECISHCLKLDYPSLEVIAVTNKSVDIPHGVISVLTEGESQGEKKDVGWKIASGEICAFVDDDAFPHPDWLKNAVEYFTNPEIVAVCGPGVTPPSDSLLQRVSGSIYASPLGSGPFNFRYVPKKPRFIDEFVGYNLIIRKSALKALGGISTVYRSGEDTHLSDKINRYRMGRVLYAPDVVVYHHRRPFPRRHLGQVLNYAIHRGHFARKFGGLSRSALYGIPVVLLASVAGLLLASTLIPSLLRLVLYLGAGYFLAGFASSMLVDRDPRVGSLAAIGIPLTHATYALGFAVGLIKADLGERPSY